MRSDSQPRSIQVHASDNVAIVVNEGGLPAGTRFETGLVLRDAIPEAHKVALVTIAAGAPIIRYGVTIGYAQTEIPGGSWVHEGLLALPQAPALDKLPIPEGVRTRSTPLEGFTFEGYVNDDGTVGTKNILGISTTVQCVSATVEYAVKKIKAELLPKYPNVDDVIAITHLYGCGVAINAPGSEIPLAELRWSSVLGARSCSRRRCFPAVHYRSSRADPMLFVYRMTSIGVLAT
jgi:galactarate dehydratase